MCGWLKRRQPIAVAILMALTGTTAFSAESLLGGGRALADLPFVASPSQFSAPGETVSYRTLVLNCVKVNQAQRSLEMARRHGARLTPLFPGYEIIPTEPPSPEAVYHIEKNQERFNALSRRMQCASR